MSKERVLRMIDVHGVLDRCAECGAYAAFIIGSDRRSVVCTECANCVLDTDVACAEWNKQQRAVKNKARPKWQRKTKRSKGQ